MFNIDSSRSLSLYVHIPFCRRKCLYCGFYSLPGCSASEVSAFTAKMGAEIDALAGYLQKPFDTVFFGGGNPGVLGVKDLYALAEKCCRFGRPREFSMEINPESLDASFSPVFDYVDRLSVGVQSLSEKNLAVLGRNSSLHETLAGIETSQKLREKYSFSLNYDLICAVPGTETSGIDDISRLFSLGSFDHLSLYSLIVEEGTPLADLVDPMDDDLVADELEKNWAELENRGMEHYEVSNFCFPGRECRHNLAYWRMDQYFGLGPGAASTVFSPYSRVECSPDLDSYLAGPHFSGYGVEELGRKEAFEEWAIMGLRTRFGLSRDECLSRFGFSLPVLSYPGFVDDGVSFRPQGQGFLLADGAAQYVVETVFELL